MKGYRPYSKGEPMHCKHCNRKTLHETPVVFGMRWGCLFTLLTGGLFLIPWFVLGCLPRRQVCQSCGTKRF